MRSMGTPRAGGRAKSTCSVDGDDPDATEHSSSFGDTGSGSGGGMKVDCSDSEVDSGVSAISDRHSRVFRKKKVTDHWRGFIHPVMWRCRWLELRMKELQSQALIYDKELEAYNYNMQLHSKVVELDNSASRLVPLNYQSNRKQAMRRRKRKRNEDTLNLSSYMSNHHIFSYYENKRPETEGHSVDDDCEDPVDEKVNNDLEWSVFRFRHYDSSLEQILLDTEAVRSRVLKLKSHLNEVMCKNGREIYTKLGKYFPGDPLKSLHHISEFEPEDTVIPGSAVSSYGDVADLDVIESKMGLFSETDIPQKQREIGKLYKEAAEEVLQNFVKKHQEVVKQEAESSEEASSGPEVSMPKPCPEGEKVDMLTQLVPKPPYTGKRRGRKPKRRRGRGALVTY